MLSWVIMLTSPVVLGARILQFTGKYREESTMTAVLKPSVSHSRLKLTLSVALSRLTPLNLVGQVILHCVVEHSFGGQTNRSISSGQLTVRGM